MYNATFLSDSGRLFQFGFEHGTVFDITQLGGVTVNIETSQGFQQTGTTIQNRSVSGIERQINGAIFRDLETVKNNMLYAFSPMASGRLFFNDVFYCDCVVKSTPEFSTRTGKFSLSVYCRYPYWLTAEAHNYIVGGYTPAFRFPVNYATPHRFGVKNPSAFVDCRNGGVVGMYYEVEFSALAPVETYGIENATTGEYLRMNDNLEIGDKVRVYRTPEGVLKVEKNGEDAFSLLDEESDLFIMQIGENQIKATAESGIDNLVAVVKFSDAYSGVYDGIKPLR